MAGGGKRPGAGRPKGAQSKARAEIRDLAQQYTDESMLTLAEIMRNDDAPAVARAHCAEVLLAYGHGKPRQQIEHTGKDGERLFDPTKLSDEQLAAIALGGGAGAADEEEGESEP